MGRMRVIIDGIGVDDANAGISVFDWAFLRGLGVFEVARAYGTALFRLDPHLDRLARSAASLGIPLPDRAAIATDMARLAEENGSGHVRVILTAGGRDSLTPAAPRVVIIWEPLMSVLDRVRVFPVVAPWHPATAESGFPGVKWTSYAPNMAVTDAVRAAGYDDAMLLTPDGVVLEGPTSSFAWVHAGRIETPSLDLGILPSITRDVMLECCGRLGLDVEEGRFSLDRVLAADEVMALSTVREVVPVARVGERVIPDGSITALVAAEFSAVVTAETGWTEPASVASP